MRLVRSSVARIGAVLLAFCCGITHAGEVTLKNGLVLTGTPKKLQALNLDSIHGRTGELGYPFLMIENGYQRIFVSQKQARRVDPRDDLMKFETFTLKQRHTSAKSIPPSRILETSPFDKFGHRKITLSTERDQLPVFVGATKITPNYVAVTGLSYQWDFGVATNSIPPASLDLMIRHVSDLKNPDHRFAIARFFLQASLYDESAKELDSIAKDFPELKQRVADAKHELQNYEHKLILLELHRRKAAGQHELAYAYAHQVPQNEASATVLQDVRTLIKDYESGRERIAKARIVLGELQAKLGDPALVSAVMPLRSVLDDQLTLESVERLQAFFNLVDDPSLRPAEKLALAYSGWVLGSASAVTDLPLAIRFWQAQHAVLDYLRAETPQDRSDRLKEIETLDGVGPDIVIKLIRSLPPLVETPEAAPALPAKISVASSGDAKVSYDVLLPPEYDCRHQYPMIVALHPAERPGSAELEWWGGTQADPGNAQRRGYIVIAPEYAEANAHHYVYSVTAHDVVLRAIIDARRRFNVDSDRIFLSGHGMGADAAFDIGMSHPDLFAGVIPIVGVCDQVCKWYWPNSAYTAWYVVTGESDRQTFATNAVTLGRMMQKGIDVVLVDFKQRGYESYFEENPRIFEWMEPLRRRKLPREFDMKILRPTENRFYWLRADELPSSVLQPLVFVGSGRANIQPMPLGAKITPAGNTIYLTSAAKSHTVWLAPELISFDKRISIRLRGQQKYHGVPHPSIEAILEDFRFRADKQLLYTARIDLD
jgi:hypothetical protein